MLIIRKDNKSEDGQIVNFQIRNRALTFNLCLLNKPTVKKVVNILNIEY